MIDRTWFRLLIYSLIIIFCSLFWFGVYKCFSEDVDIMRVVSLESSGDAGVFNPASKACGLMQITPICLREWNQNHPLDSYDFDDLFNAEVNIKIGTWYINEKIPKYLNFYKIADTLENRLIAYNWGIGNLTKYYRGADIKIPEETKNYVKKYGGLI